MFKTQKDIKNDKNILATGKLKNGQIVQVRLGDLDKYSDRVVAQEKPDMEPPRPRPKSRS